MGMLMEVTKNFHNESTKIQLQIFNHYRTHESKHDLQSMHCHYFIMFHHTTRDNNHQLHYTYAKFISCSPIKYCQFYQTWQLNILPHPIATNSPFSPNCTIKLHCHTCITNSPICTCLTNPVDISLTSSSTPNCAAHSSCCNCHSNLSTI